MANEKGPLEKIARIRQRGQFTVPLEVRKALAWPKGGVLVRVVPLPQEDSFKVERVAMPRESTPRKKLDQKDWDDIWQSMRRISRLGKAVNLTEFLTRDRESH